MDVPPNSTNREWLSERIPSENERKKRAKIISKRAPVGSISNETDFWSTWEVCINSENQAKRKKRAKKRAKLLAKDASYDTRLLTPFSSNNFSPRFCTSFSQKTGKAGKTGKISHLWKFTRGQNIWNASRSRVPIFGEEKNLEIVKNCPIFFGGEFPTKKSFVALFAQKLYLVCDWCGFSRRS